MPPASSTPLGRNRHSWRLNEDPSARLAVVEPVPGPGRAAAPRGAGRGCGGVPGRCGASREPWRGCEGRVSRTRPAPLREAPPVIRFHAAFAFAAIGLGVTQCLAPKGTLSHRTIGWAWAILMILV